MKEHSVYLRPDVAIEPVVNQWYAWTYLLSPATAAMYISNAHLMLMKSFVTTPQTHVMALKNPAMRGGPFVDLDASRVEEVRALEKLTEQRQSHIVAFAEAIKALDKILAEANGMSLESLYPSVPEPLRGYVELVYDLQHHATIRFIEGLLFRSPYYDKSSQGIVLSTIGASHRPFAFSTPRLLNEGDVRVELEFASPAYDELYRARYEPRSLGQLTDLLKVPDADAGKFAALFTERAPNPRARYEGDAVRVRYLGHACLLIEARGVSILLDPLISHDFDCGVERFSHADLPPFIDYALVTHSHQDHCVMETLLELRHRIGRVLVPRSTGGSLMDPSLKLVLEHAGFRNVTEVGEMEAIPVEGGEITGLPFLGEHGDLNVQTKIAYHIRLGGRSVVVVADSNNIEARMYDHIHKAMGDIDVLFIGMECEGAPMSWNYGPLFTKPVSRKMDQSRRFDGSNFTKAASMVDRFHPKQVYVYALGQEPWLAHLMSFQYTEASPQIVESNKLRGYCQERGIIMERPYCRKEILLERHS
jgi:L-ascorbate metabolism protein UlaG (beta-lactamase superfamily)